LDMPLARWEIHVRIWDVGVCLQSTAEFSELWEFSLSLAGSSPWTPSAPVPACRLVVRWLPRSLQQKARASMMPGTEFLGLPAACSRVPRPSLLPIASAAAIFAQSATKVVKCRCFQWGMWWFPQWFGNVGNAPNLYVMLAIITPTLIVTLIMS
jgi:hypothetical protein